jgi:hypothetical protein
MTHEEVQPFLVAIAKALGNTEPEQFAALVLQHMADPEPLAAVTE